ncbi:MAG TPA: monovalent cation/H+ antiporter subunit D [Burkholderiaceae bacterium]|nr:monovalent cation/H+ antiporter subunit D [Burkholderiaceae bacterium]
MNWTDHLVVAPVLVPLLAGALMVLLDESQRRLRFGIAVFSAFVQVGIAVALAGLADGRQGEWIDSVGVYIAANWPVPFGIALAVDRLSAVLLLLAAVLSLSALVFARARWERAGVHFYPLFQFLMMGVNGAFLTADLFNLFVFFEVMLAASYGLVLHGSGQERVRSGMHYVAVNLLASSFFLIGVSMIYGVTGTLNMADLARVAPRVAAEDRMLLEAAVAILGIAFLIKSAMWPLNFWLVPAYSAATPPVAAAFGIMTKVGVYVIMRLWVLIFVEGAGDSTGFGRELLLWGGMATLAYGLVGMLAANDLGRLAAYSIVMSSGTLLAAIGFGNTAMISAAIYYLVSATLAVAAMFLLIELVDRSRAFGAGVLAVTFEVFETQGRMHARDDDEPGEEAGVVIPAAMAFLGLSYVCCALLIAGLPPLSGFLAKFALLTAALNPDGIAVSASADVGVDSWTLLVLLIASGLAGAIALGRIGIRAFWVPVRREPPRLRVIEVLPIAGLLLLSVAITVHAGPVMRYLDDAAAALRVGDDYTRSLLSAPRVPSPAPSAPAAAGGSQ